MTFYSFLQKYVRGALIRLFRITVVGAENEPSEGGYLVCSNHISMLDVIVTAVAVKKQIRFMAKKELFSIPGLKQLITALGAFPVDRKGSAVSSIKTTIKLLQSGEAVGIFPQGHRFPKKELEETRDSVKGGAAMAVYHAKVPVLPMYVETKNAKIRLFRPITIHVGKPIAWEDFHFTTGGTKEYEAGAAKIFDAIIATRDAARLNPGK